MQNKEFFENYGTEKWAVEQNLCFLLQEYWEAVRERTGVGRTLEANMPLNPVSFVKEFMKEETLVDIKYAEMSKMDTMEKKNVGVVDADYRELGEDFDR